MTENPYLKRRSKKGKGEAGRKAERNLSKRVGGRVTIASGALDFQKGDIHAGDFLIESKSTEKESFSLPLNYLCKIKAESLSDNKCPALAINFTTSNGNLRSMGSWVLIEEHEFKQYMEYKKSIQDEE